jgi:hypothetical protein
MLRQLAGSSDFSDPNALPRFIPATRAPQSKVFAILNALSRAGSLYRRAGGRSRRHHDRHQHGRPRHRRSARRQSDMRIARLVAEIDDWQARDKHPRAAEIRAKSHDSNSAAPRPACARHRSENRRIDNRCAAVPDARATRATRSFSVARRRSDAHLRYRQARRHADQARRKENEAIIHPGSTGAGEGATEVERATSISARTS